MTTRDAFDVLGLAPRFDLNPADLQRAYLAALTARHPDRQTETGVGDDQTAAEINDAKRALENPLTRAGLLLRRVEARTGVPAGAPAKDKALPPGFLAEIMSVREEIEAAAGNPDEIAKWEDWALERRRAHAARVTELLARSESAGDPALLDELRTELNVWRYTERLLEQLD